MPLWLERRGGKLVALTLHINAVSVQIISLQLYDCRGRKAGPMLRRTVPAGSQTIRWDLPELPAGFLYAVLDANGARTRSRITNQ
jgi:hypothetical protein